MDSLCRSSIFTRFFEPRAFNGDASTNTGGLNEKY